MLLDDFESSFEELTKERPACDPCKKQLRIKAYPQAILPSCGISLIKDCKCYNLRENDLVQASNMKL